MYKIKRDTENTALIEKKFVLKSVSEGYSRKYIRKNLNCIIRSAGRSENLVALVIAGELLAMLDDLNEFESTGEEYLQAISDIKGASKLSKLIMRTKKTVKKQLIFLKKIEYILKPQPWKKQRNGLKHMI